jgi:HSP20 family protein
MTQFRVKTPVYVPGFLNAMDKFLSEDFNTAFRNEQRPAVNIIEKDNQYDIVLMAPGLSKTDFKISLDDNMLTISYEKSEEKTEESPKFVRREFDMKSFKRTFTVNDTLDVDQISASYENGLLTVSLPKAENKESKVKTIEIV